MSIPPKHANAGYPGYKPSLAGAGRLPHGGAGRHQHGESRTKALTNTRCSDDISWPCHIQVSCAKRQQVSNWTRQRAWTRMRPVVCGGRLSTRPEATQKRDVSGRWLVCPAVQPVNACRCADTEAVVGRYIGGVSTGRQLRENGEYKGMTRRRRASVGILLVVRYVRIRPLECAVRCAAQGVH